MLDEIFGIPAHPLLVHAAVVFVPLQVGVAIAYALVPFTRKHLWWLVGALAVAAPAAAWFAKLSGENFFETLNLDPNSEFGKQVIEHQDLADIAAWASLGLGILMLAVLAVHLGPARRAKAGRATEVDAGATPAAGPNKVVGLVLGLVILALGVVTAYYIVRAGHTGATAVWG